MTEPAVKDIGAQLGRQYEPGAIDFSSEASARVERRARQIGEAEMGRPIADDHWDGLWAYYENASDPIAEAMAVYKWHQTALAEAEQVAA